MTWPLPAPLPGLAALDGVTPVFVEHGADPRVSPGLDLPIGSRVKYGALYFSKVGSAASDWERDATAVSVTVSGAATRTIEFTGLNGDRDHVYDFLLRYQVSAPTYPMVLPNGAVTSLARNDLLHYQGGGVADAYSYEADGIVGTVGTVPSGGVVNGMLTGRIFAKSGAYRYLYSFHQVELGNPVSNTVQDHANLMWKDSATNLTSLRFYVNDLPGWAVGTTATLWVPREVRF